MNTASQYDRFTAHIEAERDQIAADYQALAEQHAEELAQLREAARAYRSVLYGADGRGLLGGVLGGEGLVVGGDLVALGLDVGGESVVLGCGVHGVVLSVSAWLRQGRGCHPPADPGAGPGFAASDFGSTR